MSMKNMSMSNEEMKESQPTAINSADKQEGPMYPYGLNICLEDKSLQKLGVKQLPKVGQSMLIRAKVDVSSISEYESIEGGNRRSMNLQITDLELVGVKREVSADKLYSNQESAHGKTYGKLGGEQKDGG